MTENTKKTAAAIYALHHLHRWTERTESLKVSYDELRGEVMASSGKSMLQSMLKTFGWGWDGVKLFINSSFRWKDTVQGFEYWTLAHRLWMEEWDRIRMSDIPASLEGFMEQL